jgi:hypothetical protein
MADGGGPVRSDRDEPGGVELWLAPFFRDSTLWPVLAVVAAVFVLFGALGILLAVVERNPAAVAAMLGLAWGSLDALIRYGRGSGSWRLVFFVIGFWVLSIAAAIGAVWTGWFQVDRFR